MKYFATSDPMKRLRGYISLSQSNTNICTNHTISKAEIFNYKVVAAHSYRLETFVERERKVK